MGTTWRPETNRNIGHVTEVYHKTKNLFGAKICTDMSLQLFLNMRVKS